MASDVIARRLTQSDELPQDSEQMASQGWGAILRALGKHLKGQYDEGQERLDKAMGPLDSPETRQALLGLGEHVASGTFGESPKGPKAKGLDMSEASRMARAKEMGFDTEKTYYHGTNAPDIHQFDPNHSPIHDPSADGRGAVFFSEKPEFADNFNRKTETHGQVIPVNLKVKNAFDYENPSHVNQIVDGLSDKELRAINGRSPVEDKEVYKEFLKRQIGLGSWLYVEKPEIMSAMKSKGFDAFHVHEMGSKNMAVFEPNQIRSKFAAFDPKKSGSGNISAGIAGAIGAGAMARRMANQEKDKESGL
jgi:hypothetical protein